MFCFLCKKKRRRDHEASHSPKVGGELQQQNQVVKSLPPRKPPSQLPLPSPFKGSFSYEELASATDGFSEANLLGQCVYKGTLLSHKIEIAVKLMQAGSAQGNSEFRSEVEILSRVHHEHLVALIGYCVTDAHILLVYEFVPNNTLEFHLHGKGRPPMKWNTRFKIAIGSAKGLSYLHETCYPKIIHRNIKSANIFVDSKFEAKIANFGLAKIGPETDTRVVATRMMGTFGYLAPEYAATGLLTEKCDVYSFGIVLLELITGRRPIDENNDYGDESFVDWARPLLLRAIEEDNFEVIVDKNLKNEYARKEMGRMVECAAACVRYSARRRPRMSQVERALEETYITSSKYSNQTNDS